MNRNGKPKALHPVDGRMMTVDEIADMLGMTRKALYVRRSRLGGASYQTIVDMYRSNAIGHDKCFRYLVDGRWMTTRQIAKMLGIEAHTLSSYRWQNKASMEEAIAWYRQLQTGERKRNPGVGGRPAIRYRVGNHEYTVSQVAAKFDVKVQTVRKILQRRGGDMGAVLRFYREKDKRARAKAEKEIMRILGY